MRKSKINYLDYIVKNPLYIHNHKRYFDQTVKKIDSIDPLGRAKDLFNKYLGYLESREEDILNRLGGGKKGKDALELMAKEAFTANENIGKIVELLDQIFYMNKDLKASVYRGKDGEVYLRLTKSGKGNKRQLVANTKLILGEIKTVRAHGRDVNNYDYESSAKVIDKNMEQALILMVQDIQKAIGSQKQINNEISKLVNTTQLSKELTDGPLGQYVSLALSFDAQPSTELLLKFIVEKLGTYIALKGQFTEASEIEFTSGVKELFGNDFGSQRGDTRTHEERQGTFKKPDLILSGGKIDAKLNPITISMKTIGKSGKIKVQNSPLMGNSGGIYQAILKDDESLANSYLYFMINNPYYNNSEATKLIESINKYISYLFISGNFKTEKGNYELPINQALYLVLNEGHGKNIKTSFIPVSSILKNIENGENSIKITNTKKSDIDLEDLKSSILWRSKIYSLSKKYNNSEDSLDLTYENLYNKQLVINSVKEVAGNLLTKDRKVEISYNISKGIIV